ncbi:MAG: DNA repair protein RecN, partial [Demequinaceae bacterium]|nr:DNA repair protein RecN [Demequinaceae bacterium]
TFVFDEVDAGVGGRAAIDVARRLALLARSQQVLVVTHLAQVAAFADHHIVVTKDTDGVVTTSEVREVTGEDRVQEIARLLSGQEDSTTARAHALELLEGSTVTR